MRDNINNLSSYAPATYQLTKADSSIICQNVINRLKVLEVWHKDLRNSLTFAEYEEKYAVIMHSLDFKNLRPLQSILHIIPTAPHVSNGRSYAVSSINGFEFEFLGDKTDTLEELNIGFGDDSLVMDVLNDSIIGFRLNCRTISLAYSRNSPVDVLLGLKETSSRKLRLPLGVAFFRREKKLFFAFVVNLKGEEMIRPDLLGELFCLH